MGAKVLKTIVVALGVLVLAVLAFVAVYIIGYSAVAMFGHGGMGGTARGIGAGLAAIVAILVVALYFRSRDRTQVAESASRRHGKRAA